MQHLKLLRASVIAGHQVTNNEGEDLGKIIDTVIDTYSNKLSYYVLSFGGFIGLGDKLFAIPPEAMHYDATEGKYLLNVDKEALKKAKGFDQDNWPDLEDAGYRETIYSNYGYEQTTPY